MTLRWRWLVFMTAVGLIVCAGEGIAQTVIVKDAPAGTRVELVLNTTAVAMAMTDQEGLATLAVPRSESAAGETAVQLFVDRCSNILRVLVVGRTATPAAEGGCTRQAIPGSYVMRRVTSFVVEVGGTTPVLWSTQGPAPLSWIRPPRTAEEGSGRAWGPLPTGLVLFGSPGLATYSDLTTVACGSAASCNGSFSRPSYAFGAAYWFNPFLAAEVQYVNPSKGVVSGSDTNLRFDSSLEAPLVSVAGVVGRAIGPVRLYGRAGVNRHRATLHTTQTVDETSVTTEQGTQTIRGGTQTLDLETEGWGLVFGGGTEVWLSPRAALYGDLTRASLKGNATAIPEGTIDDNAWLVQVGVRIHVWR